MQERHKDREKYFREQATCVERHVLPFLKSESRIEADTSVLEIGCGEGGNLKPFLDAGCEKITGIDFSDNKIRNAHTFFNFHPHVGKLTLLCANIFDITGHNEYDLIFTRDVLEHIHNQERFLEHIKSFLKPGGKVFFGFPPWQNPFGGHQQMCDSKILSKIPFFHLLPKSIYKLVLGIFGETKAKIEGLLEVKETGISIERFERILSRTGYRIDKKVHYLMNPNYEVKFGIKPRILPKPFSSIPWLRNFIITTSYYIVSLK